MISFGTPGAMTPAIINKANISHAGPKGNYVSQSGLYNPTGLGNIDIMLRDSPFIGLQYNNGTGVSTLSNSLVYLMLLAVPQ